EVYVWELDGSVKPGFPKSTSGVCKGAPAVGDIDGDGVYEIVIPAYDESNNDYLYVWDAFGNPEPGWPQRAGRCRLSHPALADIDGDGQLEILIGGGRVNTPYRSVLFAFEPSGEAVTGFPIEIPHGSQINSGPIVGDLDGDPTLLEIVVKVSNHIYAYHSDGSLVAGFPYEQSDESHSGTHSPTPAMADVDEDGDLELLFCSCFDHVDFVDLNDPVDLSLAYWPSMKLDACNSSFMYAGSGTWVPPAFEEGGFTILLQNVPNPLRSGSSTWIPFRLGRQSSCGTSRGSFWIEILDPQGRCLRTIPVVDQQGGSSRVAWDGQDKFGVPVPSGVYLYRLAGAERSRARTMQVLR
ncbi:MAG: VCBS repeat-containing protein, partial [Candidatus Eisenbacteria sp.]|nr:VCBS repeat-containing protein [Candidatus Eisenbacteria bacterium]